MNRRQYEHRRKLRKELAKARQATAEAQRRAAEAAHYAEVMEHRLALGGSGTPRPAPKPKKSAVEMLMSGELTESQAVESLAYYDYLSPVLDQMSEYRQYPEFGGIWNVVTDHKHGAYWPFWRTEPELAFLRTASRVTVKINNNAGGLLRGLTGYVVGKGFEARVTTKDNEEVPAWVLKRCQDVLDEFTERTLWYELQRELFESSREDGEFFLRSYHRPDGRTVVRRIWPESVMQPPGTDLAEWSFGIRTDPDDLETVEEYYVADPNHPGEGDYVPADEVEHLKLNVKRGVKRGMPDFAFDTREVLEMARRLRRNLSVGGALQASIAWIEQYVASPESAVQGLANSKRDAELPRHSPIGDRTSDQEQWESGTIVRTGKGKEYVTPPGPAAAEAHLSILNACYRGAAVRWNAPEWLSSADASNNNFSSSLTAESPFVRTGELEQMAYAVRFKRVLKKVIRHALRSGLIPGVSERVLSLIDVQVTPPLMAVRDKGAEVQRLSQEIQLGLTSKQTAAQELGRDWENEQTNIRAEADQDSPQAAAQPGGGGGGGDPLAALFGGEATEADSVWVQEGDWLVEFERRTDKRGNAYCYEKGKGRVRCSGGDDVAAKAKAAHDAGDYEELEKHVRRMTREELRGHAAAIEQAFGKGVRLKAQMVERLLARPEKAKEEEKGEKKVADEQTPESRAESRMGRSDVISTDDWDGPTRRALDDIEGSALKSNRDQPIIVSQNPDGSYRILDGFGRAAGLRNAGSSRIHAIVIGPDDLPPGRDTIADDDDVIADIHYRYEPGSILAKPGGNPERFGIYYNDFEDADKDNKYDVIEPFMMPREAWVETQMEDGMSRKEAEDEHREDLEVTLEKTPHLVHRFVLADYPDLAASEKSPSTGVDNASTPVDNTSAGSGGPDPERTGEKAMELPELKGSEKQVKWANEIRAKWLGEAPQRLETYRKQAEYEESIGNAERAAENRASQAKYAAFIDWLAEKTNAKWFIDNRSAKAWELFEDKPAAVSNQRAEVLAQVRDKFGDDAEAAIDRYLRDGENDDFFDELDDAWDERYPPGPMGRRDMPDFWTHLQEIRRLWKEGEKTPSTGADNASTLVDNASVGPGGPDPERTGDEAMTPEPIYQQFIEAEYSLPEGANGYQKVSHYGNLWKAAEEAGLSVTPPALPSDLRDSFSAAADRLGARQFSEVRTTRISPTPEVARELAEIAASLEAQSRERRRAAADKINAEKSVRSRHHQQLATDMGHRATGDAVDRVASLGMMSKDQALRIAEKYKVGSVIDVNGISHVITEAQKPWYDNRDKVATGESRYGKAGWHVAFVAVPVEGEK